MLKSVSQENSPAVPGTYLISDGKNSEIVLLRALEEEMGELLAQRLIYEGADLLYHLIVLLTSKGYRIEDLARELEERHSATWKKH